MDLVRWFIVPLRALRCGARASPGVYALSYASSLLCFRILATNVFKFIQTDALRVPERPTKTL